MKNDLEESDPAIVATNLANNAGVSVAEQGEPRAGTKGNADQQSTRRAQDRESVSHALDRIRNAARQRKKEKFTALFHHINPEMLRTAFYALKRNAAPGVDGQTWRTYEADLNQRIVDLHSRVERGVYRAHPSRRTWAWQTGDVQLPRFYAHLRQDPAWPVPDPPEKPEGPKNGEADGG